MYLQDKLKPELTFNPGLALIGFLATGPSSLSNGLWLVSLQITTTLQYFILGMRKITSASLAIIYDSKYITQTLKGLCDAIFCNSVTYNSNYSQTDLY